MRHQRIQPESASYLDSNRLESPCLLTDDERLLCVEALRLMVIQLQETQRQIARVMPKANLIERCSVWMEQAQDLRERLERV